MGQGYLDTTSTGEVKKGWTSGGVLVQREFQKKKLIRKDKIRFDNYQSGKGYLEK